MPSAPVITFTDALSSNISSYNFGNAASGSSSTPVTLYVWNNKGGGTVVSNATSVTLSTVTLNGQTTGGTDTVANGQQVVNDLILALKCTSQGDSAFTAVGGTTSAPIGSSAGGSGVILGSVGGDAAVVEFELQVPSSVTPGAAAWLARVSYLYS